MGYFSTADRSDANRCREDFRYLKRLIYDIEDIKQMKQLKVELLTAYQDVEAGIRDAEEE